MRNRSITACILVCSVGLSSCAAQGGFSRNQTTGAGVGCLLGAVIGMALLKNNQTGAALGCAAGGTVGLSIGTALDEKERRELAEASIRAAAQGHTGQRIEWGYSAEVAQTPPSRGRYHAKKGGKGQTDSASNWVIPNSEKKVAKVDPNAATGWVVPVNDPYVASNGDTCRDLQQVANKGGKTYQQNIRACKTAQGWVLPQA